MVVSRGKPTLISLVWSYANPSALMGLTHNIEDGHSNGKKNTDYPTYLILLTGGVFLRLQ